MPEAISNMTLGEMVGYAALIIAALSTVIEVSKIKLNPWSWLGRKIGKVINGEVVSKVDNLQREIEGVKVDVTDMQRNIAEKEARTARTKMLRFGDEIRRGVRHSKDHFDDILQSCTEYEQYCQSHPEFKNHMTERTMALITKTYDKCLEENSFL